MRLGSGKKKTLILLVPGCLALAVADVVVLTAGAGVEVGLPVVGLFGLGADLVVGKKSRMLVAAT